MQRPVNLSENCLALWDRLRGRDYRNFLLRVLPQRSAGCEIGVWQGDFSSEIVRTVRPSRLLLIDPWSFQPEFADSWYGGALMKTQAEMDAVYERVHTRFAERSEVEILRGKTSDVENRIGTAEFDWVYIDGNHEYSHVRLDLEFAQRVVKPGGLIVGDDYDRSAPGEPSPVTRAVHDYLRTGGAEMLWVCRHQFCLRRR